MERTIAVVMMDSTELDSIVQVDHNKDIVFQGLLRLICLLKLPTLIFMFYVLCISNQNPDLSEHFRQ